MCVVSISACNFILTVAVIHNMNCYFLLLLMIPKTNIKRTDHEAAMRSLAVVTVLVTRQTVDEEAVH